VSFLSKAWKAVRGIAAPAIGMAVGGPMGGAIGSVLAGGAGRAIGQLPAAPMPGSQYHAQAMPGGSQTVGFALPALPAMGAAAMRLAPALGGLAAGARVGVAGARMLARSAASYCKKHPAWCASIGGLAAVEGLVRSGQLPPVKRRRAKGITGTELRNFKRVSRTLNKWCKVPAPTQRARRKC